MKRLFAVVLVAFLIVATVLITAAPALAAPYETGIWTGRGTVGSSVNVTFSFRSHHSLGYEDSMKVAWGHYRFQLTQLTYVEVVDDPTISPEPPAVNDTMHGIGVGECNGVAGCQVEFIFTDAGEGGQYDWAWIKITDLSAATVLETSGFLAKGNIRAG